MISSNTLVHVLLGFINMSLGLSYVSSQLKHGIIGKLMLIVIWLGLIVHYVHVFFVGMEFISVSFGN